MECLDLQKIEYPGLRKFNEEIVYIIYVQKVWICRKIEYPELRKFNGKLYTLYMYGTSGFAEKLNIYNCKNSIGNCVHDICKECLDLKKNRISRAVKIQRKIVYVIYVWNVWISKKIES